MHAGGATHHWDVHVWDLVTLEHLKQRPCEDWRAPQHAAKGVVLQIRVVELAIDDVEACAPPRREVFVRGLGCAEDD